MCVVGIHISHAHPRGDFRSFIHQDDVWGGPRHAQNTGETILRLVLAYRTALCARAEGEEAPLALERAVTRGAVFALKSALMDELWAGKLTMRGADEIEVMHSDQHIA